MMKPELGLVLLVFMSLSTAAPTDNNKDYSPKLVIYEGKHDIVNVVVNWNKSEIELHRSHVPLFFLEADITDDGKRIDQGFYVLKDRTATKLLNHGRDIVSGIYSEYVFIGAKDGIYRYSDKDGKTEKYGTVTDSIIQIARENTSDVFYILTEDHKLYKVTNNGNNKEITDIDNPQEFALDFRNNIYFYTSDKELKVKTREGIRKIHGLPSNPSSLKLLRPLYVLQDAVPLIVDNTAYFIFGNGISYKGARVPTDQPTAYSFEGAPFLYNLAHDKKIYQHNQTGPVEFIDKIIDEL